MPPPSAPTPGSLYLHSIPYVPTRNDWQRVQGNVLTLMCATKTDHGFIFEGSTRGGTVLPKPDPVLFPGHLGKALIGMDGVIWAMPVDTFMSGGTVPPAVDPCAPTRVDALPSLLSPNLAVRHTVVPDTLVFIPLVEGNFRDRPYEQETGGGFSTRSKRGRETHRQQHDRFGQDGARRPRGVGGR